MIRSVTFALLVGVAAPPAAPALQEPGAGSGGRAGHGQRLRAPVPSATGGGAGRIDLSQSGARISASEAATIVRDSTGGRVLGVRTESLAGRAVYRVKLLTSEGRVRMVRVDATSGRILR